MTSVGALTKPRGILLAANWKMHHGPRQTGEYFDGLLAAVSKSSFPLSKNLTSNQLEWGFFVPSISLATAQSKSQAAGFPVWVGSQNTSWEEKGAFTGEISIPMIRELGVSWTLVGHSERRQFFGETDETARKRCLKALVSGVRVVFCFGETLEDRQANRTQDVIFDQLSRGLDDGVAPFLDGRLVLAYEPVWAIGTGVNAEPYEAEVVHQSVRRMLWDRFGMEASGRTRILYGGSVKPANILELMQCPNIDGALIGGASLEVDSFIQMAEKASACL